MSCAANSFTAGAHSVLVDDEKQPVNVAWLKPVERANEGSSDGGDRTLARHARDHDAVMRAQRVGDDVREVDVATRQRPRILLCMREDLRIGGAGQADVARVDNVSADRRERGTHRARQALIDEDAQAHSDRPDFFTRNDLRCISDGREDIVRGDAVLLRNFGNGVTRADVADDRRDHDAGALDDRLAVTHGGIG